MRITVCFKTLPELAMLTGRDWRSQGLAGPDLGYVRLGFNCFEESSLELALRLAEDSDGGPGRIELTALTIDGEGADPFLRHLYATGYHDAVRIQRPEGAELRFNPQLVSALIAGYLRKSGAQDLVMLGWQGGLGDNRQTGYLLAERLGWPCLREVAGVALSDTPGCLDVTSREAPGLITRTVSPPLVLIIGNAPDASCLRTPSMRMRLEAGKRPISLIRPEALGLAGEASGHEANELLELIRLEPKESCTMIQGADLNEKARILYHQYLKDRLEP
jgi:electron transfer flavoprotein beta subunit